MIFYVVGVEDAAGEAEDVAKCFTNLIDAKREFREWRKEPYGDLGNNISLRRVVVPAGTTPLRLAMAIIEGGEWWSENEILQEAKSPAADPTFTYPNKEADVG